MHFSARMPIGQHLYKLLCVYLTDPITIKLCFLLGRKKKKTQNEKANANTSII